MGVGCQTPADKVPPHYLKDTISSDYILNRLLNRANKIRSVKSFTRTTFISKKLKQSFRQALIIKTNSSIRVDTYGAFGQAMGVFISDAGSLQFLDPSKGRLYSGSEVESLMRKMLGTHIDFREHLRVFIGHIPRIEFLKVEKSKINSDQTQYIIKAKDLKRGGYVQMHIDAMTLLPLKMIQMEFGRKQYLVHWQEYKKIGEVDWPHLITLEFPERQETLRIQYKNPILNQKISPETFQLMPSTPSVTKGVG